MPATKTAPKADPKIRSAQERLNASGFPCGKPDGIAGPKTTAAVRWFQLAFLGDVDRSELLTVDGKIGPRTLAALSRLPYLSPHFTVHELRSKGDGACYVSRDLVCGLELLREAAGQPVHVVSAARDAAHNKRVDGAKDSMHVPVPDVGALAADVQFRRAVRIEPVIALQVFSGVGDYRGNVRHVDLRHLAGKRNKTPQATPQRPARWSY